MLKAVLRSLGRVLSIYYSTWMSALAALIALLTGLFDKQIALTPTGWLILALVLVFVTAVKIQYDFDKERDKDKQPTPTIPLNVLVKTIVGSDLVGESHVPQKTLDALNQIRQQARLGRLTVWGRKNAMAGQLEHYPLERIDAEYWGHAQIEYLKYLGDARCRTSKAIGASAHTPFSDLHFDQNEIESLWPHQSKSIIGQERRTS